MEPAISINVWRLSSERGGWWHGGWVGGQGLGGAAPPLSRYHGRLFLGTTHLCAPGGDHLGCFSALHSSAMCLLGPRRAASFHLRSTPSSWAISPNWLFSLTHNWWLKRTLSRSEAQFLNFQLEAAFSHPWSLFTFHWLCQQPGAEVWRCFQHAPLGSSH